MPSPRPASIQHVSDTAIWVAHYRAMESQRPDALFHDRLAALLAGPRGRGFAAQMQRTQRYTAWSVVVRTVIIDDFIQKLVADGVDTVLNLGAGLDTRPYRLALPETLRWIEVDYPGPMAEKEEQLAAEKPGVRLERIGLDLANVEERRRLFAAIGASSKKVLVLTEGVIPYLTEEQVSSLAGDLHAEKTFQFWITEYFAPHLYQWFQNKKRQERMKNAPFVFFPRDWLGLFRAHGWVPRETRYTAAEGIRIGRKAPHPLWVRLLLKLSSPQRAEAASRFSGYIVFGRDGDGDAPGNAPSVTI